MSGTEALAAYVEGGARVQTLLFKGLAVAAGLTALGLAGALVALPMKPGDEGAVLVAGGFTALMAGSAVGFWVFAGRQVAALRRLVLDEPWRVARTEVLGIQVNNGGRIWSARFFDARGKVVGIKVPSEAHAHEVLALFTAHQAARQAARGAS